MSFSETALVLSFFAFLPPFAALAPFFLLPFAFLRAGLELELLVEAPLLSSSELSSPSPSALTPFGIVFNALSADADLAPRSLTSLACFMSREKIVDLRCSSDSL